MNSLGINVVQNGPNECMLVTGWYCTSKAERMFLEKGHWHIEWKLTANAKENVVHDLVNVYDWLMLPASVGCQGCFDENADYEGLVFVVRRRSKNEAQRKWVTASNGK